MYQVQFKYNNKEEYIEKYMQAKDIDKKLLLTWFEESSKRLENLANACNSIEEKENFMNSRISKVREIFEELPNCYLQYDHVCSICKVR